jgi:hypothetical protein
MTDDTKALAERLNYIALNGPRIGHPIGQLCADAKACIEQLERDLAAARKDAARLKYVLPMLGGDDSAEADRRTMAIAHQLMLGLTTIAAIDAARAKERG